MSVQSDLSEDLVGGLSDLSIDVKQEGDMQSRPDDQDNKSFAFDRIPCANADAGCLEGGTKGCSACSLVMYCSKVYLGNIASNVLADAFEIRHASRRTGRLTSEVRRLAPRCEQS